MEEDTVVIKHRSKKRPRSAKTRLFESYLYAKEFVISAGFGEEIDWQEDRSFGKIEEGDFLRQAAWVILSSGMREIVIRAKFTGISAAFFNWLNAAIIVRHSTRCRRKALSVFNHTLKIDAIIEISHRVVCDGFEGIRQSIQEHGVEYLRTFPFMGPATALHLAKNLGLDVVKPDRHLLRVAKAACYQSPQEMCREISKRLGEKVSVVDLVIWRFATLNRDYIDHFG